MLATLSEFRFFQAFRIPVEEADQIRFLFEREKNFDQYEDIQLRVIDISLSGIGVSSSAILSIGDTVRISVQFKKMRLEVEGYVVRATSERAKEGESIYGIHLEDSREMKKFIEKYILSLPLDRLRECMTCLSLTDRYSREGEGVDIFTLLVSLFRDLEKFASSKNFSTLILCEAAWMLQAERAGIFLIDPESNQLQALASYGGEEENPNLDYREGLAGSVFTTGNPINLQAVHNTMGITLDEGVKTVICFPFRNFVGKIIGVMEMVNKRGGGRFTKDDEKVMDILSSVFGVIFSQYDLVVRKSQVRRFSTPFDREYVIIGKSPSILSMRKNIVRLKDLSFPVLIEGEMGVGKTLLAHILHIESRRCIHSQKVLDCRLLKKEDRDKFFIPEQSLFLSLKSGTLILKHIEALPLHVQDQLYQTLRRGNFDDRNLAFDFRFIALTEQDLSKKVQDGEFHSGLFDFISRAYMKIPPLGHRMEDIESLVNYFLKIECRSQGVLLKRFSSSLMENIECMEWRGNIGELRHFVIRSVVSNLRSHVIDQIDDLSMPQLTKGRSLFREVPYLNQCGSSLKDRIILVEREMIKNEIKKFRGNKSQAAREMGISREALRKKMISSQSLLDSLSSEKIFESTEVLKKKAA